MSQLNHQTKEMVFLWDDTGLGKALFEFANDEGYVTASRVVEEWQESIEEMLEIMNKNCKKSTLSSNPIIQNLQKLHNRLKTHQCNLLIQNEIPKQ